MDWLPALIDCNGEWERTLERVHAQYQADFLERGLRFRGAPVHLRSGPRTGGKDACFWHLISEGETEEERTPDFRRCERMGWVRALIERAENHQDISIWEQARKGRTNVVIALPDFSYMVVLAKRTPKAGNPYFVLLTAHYVEYEHRREKLRKEYKSFHS